MFSVLYFLPSIVLLLPSMQRKAAGWVAGSLRSTLGVPVTLDRVDLSLWTRLEVDGIHIFDTQGDTAIAANRLQLGIDWIESVSHRQIYIGSARLFEPRLRLVEDTTTKRLNIAPILEALSSDQGESDFKLSVGAVVLRRADVLYRRGDEQALQATDLDLRLSRLRLAPSGYSVLVDELSGRLTSGFQLMGLRAEVFGWGEYLRIKDLSLSLPHSQIRSSLIRLNTLGSGLGLVDTLQLTSIELDPHDIAPLTPSLIAQIPKGVLSGKASLERNQVGALKTSVALRQGELLSLLGNAVVEVDTVGYIQDLDLEIDDFFFGGAWLSRLPSLIAPASSEQLSILDRLGSVSYQGRTHWRGGHRLLDLDGLVSTKQGQLAVKTSLSLDASGAPLGVYAKLSTERLDLTSLAGDLPLNSLGVIAELEAGRDDAHKPWHMEGAVTIPTLSARGYTYRNFSAKLSTDRQQRYRLGLVSADPNAQLSADLSGRWDGHRLSQLSGQIDVRGINPSHLGLEPNKGNSRYFSGQLRGSLSSLDWLSASGELSLPSFVMIQGSDTLHLDNLHLSLAKEGQERHIQLSAPWLSLNLRGHYNPAELPRRILRSIYRRVPILRSLDDVKTSRMDNEATLHLDIQTPPKHLDKLLPIPIHLYKSLGLYGLYDEQRDRLLVKLEADSIELAQRHLGRLRLTLDNNQLSASGDASLFAGGVLSGFEINAHTQGDELRLRCDLGADERGQRNGVIDLRALLSGAGKLVRTFDDLQAEVDLQPSRLRIHSAIWDLKPAHISLSTKRLAVDNLQLSTKGRSLRLSGALGLPTDELQAELQNINLRYILESAGVDFTMIETDLTGRARANLLHGVLYADAKVTSPHFFLEGRDAAAIDIALDWNSRDMKLNLGGIVHQDTPVAGSAKVKGHIKLDSPAGIDLLFDATDLDVGFTHVFMEDILSRLEGLATGQVRLFGRFERGVTLAGEARVRQGKFGLGIIGTEYSFTDKIRFEPSKIIFDSFSIADADGGRGEVNGYVGHDHFSNFDIHLRATNLNKLCILHTRNNKDLPIYGKAYASGEVSLVGSDSHLSLGLDVRSEALTDVTLDFNTVQVGRNLGLMRFRSLRPDHTLIDSLAIATDEQPLGVAMTLNIEVTPEAKIGMLMGYDASDGELRGKALGRLAIHVPEQGQTMVYGGLNVMEGVYTFRLEQLAQKRFSLAEGGDILFRGPIESTELDLKAIYALTASIADLDEDLLFDIRRTNVPVHCILGMTGSIVQPHIHFGIELPGMDVELERRVRSLLNTDDAVMRQMLYLITLGKFYTLDSFSRSRQSATNNLTSVASSALSEQLSYLLGNLSDKVSIGTNIKTRNVEFNDTDIELLLSGSLFDDRLLVSANVGYHDNPYLNKTYIGEFDLEYKLNRSGSLRLKGYNHYNHMYQYLRQGLTIQGVGVLFRQRFDRFGELFAPGRRRLFPSRGLSALPTPTMPDSTLTQP